MSNQLFRFRPIKRLIGDDGKSGELDSLYIYFAASGQLNDPLEGYKELFFQGDSVVWGNFVRHYIQCLVKVVVECFTSGNVVSKVGVLDSLEDFKPKVVEVNEEVYRLLNGNSVVDSYLKSVHDGRRLNKMQVNAFFKSVHPYMVDMVLEVLSSHKFCDAKVRYGVGSRDEYLTWLGQTGRNLFPKEGAPYCEEKLAQDLYKMRANDLRSRAQIAEGCDSRSVNEFFINAEFTDAYMHEIDDLIYPEWYAACFMSGCSDSALWGSYGGNHKDVCLIFNKSNIEGFYGFEFYKYPEIADLPIGREMIRFPLEDVRYGDDFIEVDFFRSLGALRPDQVEKYWYRDEEGGKSCCAEAFSDYPAWFQKHWGSFYKVTSVKVKEWENERESRLILAHITDKWKDFEKRKFRYDFSMLDGIIFGIRTSKEDRLALIHKVKRLCEKYGRETFNFYQARFDVRNKLVVYDRLEKLF